MHCGKKQNFEVSELPLMCIAYVYLLLFCIELGTLVVRLDILSKRNFLCYTRKITAFWRRNIFPIPYT